LVEGDKTKKKAGESERKIGSEHPRRGRGGKRKRWPLPKEGI